MNLIEQRLLNQRLSAPEFRKPVEVVRWFGAVQAQDFEAAKWALALRMQSATNATIEEAFNRGAILRTHVMRPTWHFVAREDIRWLLELTAPAVNVRCGSGYRMFELDDAVFKRSRKVFERALRDGKHLSRAELRRKLNESGVEANDTVRMGHILIRAELDRVVCSGPRVGKQLTYALFDERVPPAKTIDRDEALAKLTRLYFRSHGPATLQDFVWWSGFSIADARRGLEITGLEKMTMGEKLYWSVESSEVPGRSSTTAHLLPVYDEYFVAYKDRESVFGSQNGRSTWDSLGPAVVINGIAAGTWNKSIELKLTRTLKKTERVAVEQAITRAVTYFGEISRRK